MSEVGEAAVGRRSPSRGPTQLPFPPIPRLTMHLVQFLLPLYDDDGRAFGRAPFDGVRAELTERFGGVTLYLRSPASGAWKDDGGEVERDEIVMVEVMDHSLDREWWAGYRLELEERFRQDEVVVRALAAQRL
jgi:hypothetical protein